MSESIILRLSVFLFQYSRTISVEFFSFNLDLAQNNKMINFALE